MATTLVDLTPDSLLELPPPENGKHYELSEGELIVVRTAGLRHERTKRRILKALFSWEIRFAAGEVYAETQFALSERTARVPDAAVLLAEKIALLPDSDGIAPVAPDLSVEVISQTESAYNAERRLREYLAAGVKEIWQVYADQQLVRVRWADSSKDFENKEILRSRVLTGFDATVNTFFAD